MVINGTGGHLLIFPKTEECYVNSDETYKNHNAVYEGGSPMKKWYFYAQHPKKRAKKNTLEEVKEEEPRVGRMTRQAASKAATKFADQQDESSPPLAERLRTLETRLAKRYPK